MDTLKSASESEQMYLVTIAMIAEELGEFPVPVSQIAEWLQVTPISANQMIHRLEEIGLVSYRPYKGVALTSKGQQCANHILRFRRLWETFLVKHLQYGTEQAEGLACRLEHAIPVETADRLEAFLEWPRLSPRGKPIPKGDRTASLGKGTNLKNLLTGESGVVTAIQCGDAEREFLRGAGLQVGSQIKVIGSRNNGAYLIKIGTEGVLTISADMAASIWVRSTPEDEDSHTGS